MDYDIHPYDRVGQLKLGMQREIVRQLVGSPSKSFLKAGTTPTDEFDGLGIFAYYGPESQVEALEFFVPAQPTFRSFELLGKPYQEVHDWLAGLDPSFESDTAGLTSKAFGFGVYAPHAVDEPESAVEGVIVFSKGYYD